MESFAVVSSAITRIAHLYMKWTENLPSVKLSNRVYACIVPFEGFQDTSFLDSGNLGQDPAAFQSITWFGITKAQEAPPQPHPIPEPVMQRLRFWLIFQVFKRIDIAKREEEFQQIGAFDREPGPAEITPLFKPKPKAPTWKQYWKPWACGQNLISCNIIGNSLGRAPLHTQSLGIPVAASLVPCIYLLRSGGQSKGRLPPNLLTEI